MDREIIKYFKSDKERLTEFINEQSNEDIQNLITAKLDDYHATNDVDAALLLGAIIQGTPIEDSQSLQRRFLLIQCVIQWLSTEDKDIPQKSKQASSVVNLILPEFELLSTALLRDAGKLVTDIILQDQPIQLRLLDILSKIWNVLAAADEVDEVDDIFQDLMRAKWNKQLVVSLATTLNDVEMTNKQLEIALKSMINKLPDIEIEEVPSYIWQLLLISRKGHKKLVLKGMLDFFNSAKDEDTSRVEGTVMLHISFALKQDQELGNELIKMIKNSRSSQLEEFNIACLLTAARIHRLQDPIYDLIKSFVLSAYKDSDKLRKCHWIAEYSPLEADAFSRVLLSVVEKSATAGWDQVIQSLTQIAFLLIDTANSIGSAFGGNSNVITSRSSDMKEEGPMEKVASLGVDMLLRLFEYHDIVRGEILEQITSRIVSRASSTKDFLKLLATIIRVYPETAEKYLSNIKDTLNMLSFLPLPVADQLLRAILPLSKTNEQFRDSLILIFRKSLFAKDLDGRYMAVRGFLNILSEQLKEADENQESNQYSTAQGVAFEILGLLRRCFSQQCEIRTCVYNGLGSLSQAHPSFAGDVFELLNTQFMKSYERDSTILNPIKLDVCVENANTGGYPRIVEPIDVLLVNLVKSLNVASTVDVSTVTSDNISTCRDHLRSFVTRLSQASLEDFELDKTASFDMATHIGLRNNRFASLLLGAYEISIEYIFHTTDITVESSELILTLYRKRKNLISTVRDLSTNEKGKKNPHYDNESCVSLEMTSKIFKAIFAPHQEEGAKNENSTSLRDLRSDLDFAYFLVTRTCDSLKQAIDDEYCQQDDKHFGSCALVCKIYMAMLEEETSDSIYGNHKSTKKAPSVLGAIAASLLTIMEIVSHIWPDRLVELLTAIASSETEAESEPSNMTTNSAIIELVMKCKRIINSYIGNSLAPLNAEACNVVNVASFLCSKLEQDDQDFAVRSRLVVGWLSDLAKLHEIDDIGLARDITGLLIHMCAVIPEFDTIQNLCENIHQHVGDVEVPDMEPEPDASLTYQILNSRTYPTVVGKVFEFLDTSFDDLTWAIGKLKLCAADGDERSSDFEEEVCRRLDSLELILSELVKTLLKDAQAESLFKALAKAYKTLHALVKYKILFPKDVSSTFIDVISKAGVEVTDKLYKFLTAYSLQQTQEAGGASRKKKGKQAVNLKQKAKILRESKMIPNLIFAVETFERYLIQLSRKSKTDLMQYMKRSTSRDFRIHMDVLQQQQEEEEEEEESEDEKSLAKKRALDNEDTASESSSSSSKRARAH